MKRVILAAMLAAALVTGCARVERAKVPPEQADVSRFLYIENAISWAIVADRETGVMYAVSAGTYNQGEFTLLVDADGKPLIWEGTDE